MSRNSVRFRRVAIVLIAVIGATTVWCLDSNHAHPQDDDIVARPQQSDMEEFMAKKLRAAQRTLEAVMTNEFDEIRAQSAAMVDLSRHAAWKQMASTTYVQDTADFLTAAEFLSRMASEQDVTGVAAGYAGLVQSCSNCHRHVRAPRVALDVPVQRHDGELASIVR